MNPLRSLLFMLLACGAASAAPVILYETGWESAPATPAWLPGNVAPQNGWLNFNSAAGHTVVVNGTPEANVNGQDVTTPFGSQFHRFNASTSTSTEVLRLAWPDATAAFNTRPAGFNLLTGSIDIFVPQVQSADASFYGLAGFDDVDLDFGVLVQPSTSGILLIVDNNIVASAPNAIAFNTWQNLAVTANYDTGEVFASLNGTPVAGLSRISANILGGGFTDLDLFVQNALTAPTTRSIFSDNYRLEVVPEPGTFTLLAGGLGLLVLVSLRRARR
jgi:hypothetical protein